MVILRNSILSLFFVFYLTVLSRSYNNETKVGDNDLTNVVDNNDDQMINKERNAGEPIGRTRLENKGKKIKNRNKKEKKLEKQYKKKNKNGPKKNEKGSTRIGSCTGTTSHWSCCSSSSPCQENEGDCDKDSECAGSLVCGKDNCQKFNPLAHPAADCCVGSCAGGSSDWSCCSSTSPCQATQGDCDNDSDCAGSLVCGINNCKQFHPSAHDSADCCVKPTPRGHVMHMSSPNYPNKYPNNQDFRQSISVPKGHSIHVTFHDFQIEEHSSCAYDYVQFCDENGKCLNKMCGTNLPQDFTIESSTATVLLHTDGSVTSKGFILSYQPDRAAVIAANKELINKINNDPSSTWTASETSMSDKTIEEIRDHYTGLPDPPSKEEQTRASEIAEKELLGPLRRLRQTLPKSVDLTTMGSVSSVKSQGWCGSCAAFAAASTIETCMARVTGTLPNDVSEQQLLDCAWAKTADKKADMQGSNMCRASWPYRYHNWMHATNKGGIADERDYPYSVDKGTCFGDTAACAIKRYPSGSPAASNQCNPAVKNDPHGGVVTKHLQTWQATEEDIMRLLAAGHSVTSSFRVTGNLHLYGNEGQGLYQDATCTNWREPGSHEPRNHAVAVVGYGEESGVKFWKFKNSWGSGWGFSGYGKILRGVGHCGFGMEFSVPICSISCPIGWTMLATGCYKFIDSVTYQEGATKCKQDGGYLAEITSQEEQDTLWQFYQDSGLPLNWVWGVSSVWIGGNDLVEDGDWRWAQSGRKMTYNAWYNGEPNGGTKENCAQAWGHLSFKWNDLYCGYKVKALCETDSSSEKIATACEWENPPNGGSHMVAGQVNLNCQYYGTEKIKITHVLWGRQDRSTCIPSWVDTKPFSFSCSADTALTKAKQLCDGKGSCSVAASNGNFGDPCSGTWKYLTIAYSCQG